ncbi:putative F-box domain-containing protein [Tanacetum coccineum]|uniref:F-box domain-containing protein n=1 Tax=Tanacetum coccineum TaxID=301880 RepID=A0ABQ4XS70_9ASTR
MKKRGLDIHEKILLRLEVNYLIRCKSVCKSWNSLISSDRFVKSQLKRHSIEIGESRIIVSNLASSRQWECEVVSSSNGLVCICRYCTNFLVVNPSTRELKELINLPEEYAYASVSGFGYHSSIDDFKVVIGFKPLPNEDYIFKVLELKTNIWRLAVAEIPLDILDGNGILCNGAIHWLRGYYTKPVIVSFNLSKEVFKETPLPKLDVRWTLGTMKDHLYVFRPLNIQLEENEEIEIWSLVSPHGMGNDNGNCNEERVKRKRQNVISPNGDGRSVKSRRESPVYSDGGIAKKTKQSLLFHHGDCDGDGDGDGGRVERESHVFHTSDKGRAKSKSQSLLSSDSDCDGRRVKRKRREKERESLMFHSSNRGRAKSKTQRHVSSDSDDDGRRVERCWDLRTMLTI